MKARMKKLISKKRTIKEAVEQTNHESGQDIYNGTLQYYPQGTPEIEDYILLKAGILTMNVVYPSPTPKATAKFKIKQFNAF